MENFLPKHPFYFRDRPKNGEGNKGDLKSIRAEVTKHIKKDGERYS